ncbi:hypothetical protein PGT21_018545 [Puccinia graminis f. sp. tritici]|uniref:Uncharacterized protein n=1 Tax=Puccinia graminis f. sp. tritici TaxID=56615 RepID=A0A5B0LW75_PUCGR|nr:hypothetical protein PGT21_018545 [Puccinia graminis f. sp. tritici]
MVDEPPKPPAVLEAEDESTFDLSASRACQPGSYSERSRLAMSCMAMMENSMPEDSVQLTHVNLQMRLIECKLKNY